MKNLQVGYTFTNDVLGKVGLKSARIFVMANNLFTITKIFGVDPEIGSASRTRLSWDLSARV